MDAESYTDKLNIFQEDLNNIAEASWMEYKTYDYIISRLGNDYVWTEKTALVYSVGEGTAVFFRAELDGLPTRSGIKHVCGHSTHLASLMTAYLYFKDHPVPGYKIYFVFQPSEEGYPSGAQFITDNFHALKKAALGVAFHLYPCPVQGQLIDPVFALGDYFEITITKPGTHIKNKNELTTDDPLVIAARIIKRINTRKYKQFIINVGVISGGETPNSIAGQATLKGDIRALGDEAREKAYHKLLAIVNGEKSKYSGIKLYYSKVYPMIKNDQRLIKKLRELLPVDKTLTTFATEDFSLYPVRSVFLLVGTGQSQDLHEVDFHPDAKLGVIIYRYWIKLGENLRTIL